MEEVLARIESNLRRIQFQNSTPSSLKCNDLVLDLDGNRAMLQGAELPLTAKEFAILELLMKYPDKIFSKANLFQSVWNTEYISEDNTLNVHISNLRNKMKAICPDKEFIDTVCIKPRGKLLALCFFYGFQIEIKKFFMISPYTKM